jgi:hypothetical protein
MASAADALPVVVLPERMDRRLRLGPFPSARDALKFLAYAATGSTVAILVSESAGLVLIGAGFLLAVARIDGQPVERGALVFLRFHLARRRRDRDLTRRPPSALTRRGLSVARGGGYSAVIRAGGVPMAYLPPAEIARRFDQFRELLRAGSPDVVYLATLAPMRAGPVVPPPLGSERVDRGARDGYAQLARLLCDRRRVRRVDLLLRSVEGGAAAAMELEGRVESILARLAEMGVSARRLKGRSLADALEGFGVPAAGRGF